MRESGKRCCSRLVGNVFARWIGECCEVIDSRWICFLWEKYGKWIKKTKHSRHTKNTRDNRSRSFASMYHGRARWGKKNLVDCSRRVWECQSSLILAIFDSHLLAAFGVLCQTQVSFSWECWPLTMLSGVVYRSHSKRRLTDRICLVANILVHYLPIFVNLESLCRII